MKLCYICVNLAGKDAPVSADTEASVPAGLTYSRAHGAVLLCAGV